MIFCWEQFAESRIITEKISPLVSEDASKRMAWQPQIDYWHLLTVTFRDFPDVKNPLVS